MSKFRRARYRVEVFLVRLGLVIIPRLPRRLVMALARGTGRLGYHLSSPMRRVGQANLDLAFGETRSPAEKRAILRESFQTFGIVLFDIFWFTRRPRERLTRYVHFPEGLVESVGKGPEVYVTGHLGNWETLGQAVANLGLPLHSIAAPLNNPHIDRFFIPSRELTGQRILSAEGALRGLLRALREGACVAVLLDQNTRPSDGGVFVPFFGLPVPISTGPATLALRTGSQIIYGYCLPHPDGTYTVHSPGRITPEEIRERAETGAQAADRLTADIAARLEEEIRTHPGRWLWMYKRWKHIAPGTDPASYPYYSRVLDERQRPKARVVGR